MVYEQRCSCVVMLTNTHERGMTKCALYFPAKPGESMQLKNGLVLTHVDSVSLHNGDMTRRTLRLDHSASGASLSVTHLHYHAWPDHGTPDDATAIRAMCDALVPSGAASSSSTSGGQLQDPQQQVLSGPAVVHCSAGIGRTGTLIALDILRQRLRALASRGSEVTARELHDALNFPALVHALRQQRVGMVQTLEQYKFVYQALAEEIAHLLAA